MSVVGLERLVLPAPFCLSANTSLPQPDGGGSLPEGTCRGDAGQRGEGGRPSAGRNGAHSFQLSL